MSWAADLLDTFKIEILKLFSNNIQNTVSNVIVTWAARNEIEMAKKKQNNNNQGKYWFKIGWLYTNKKKS